jgi:hypothetical protein
MKKTNFVNRCLENNGKIEPLLLDPAVTDGTGLMNPSVLILNDKIIVNIRHVNYSLFHSEGKKFHHFWGPLQYLHPEDDCTLRTTNFLCELNDNLEITRTDKIDTSLLDKTPLWEFIGMEDARLFKWNDTLYHSGVRRDTTTNGQGRMELSQLEITPSSVKEVSRYRIPAPGNDGTYCEKNWMPFADKPFHYIKWSNPTEVVKVDIEKNTCTTVYLDENKIIPGVCDFRGGSQVITWRGYYLAVIHEVRLFSSELGRKDGQYLHRFVLWDQNFNVIKFSELFDFMGGEIEFCCGLTMHKGNFLVTFGFQDNAAYILQFPESIMLDMLDFNKNSLPAPNTLAPNISVPKKTFQKRILDIFQYFNEKELLELRIKMLHDHVDQFVITEANRTFTGIKKPFTLRDTLKELNIPTDKIIINEEDFSEYDNETNNWVRERLQRNVNAKFIQQNDVCIISDCDEIIDTDFIKYYESIARNNPDFILKIPMVFLIGRADLQACNENFEPKQWSIPFICLKQHVDKYPLSYIREAYSANNKIAFEQTYALDDGKVKNAGWHFSWMGDNSRRVIKYKSFAHYNEPIWHTKFSSSAENILTHLEVYKPAINSTDCLGRTDHMMSEYPIKNLPKKIFELENVKNFLLPS